MWFRRRVDEHPQRAASAAGRCARRVGSGRSVRFGSRRTGCAGSAPQRCRSRRPVRPTCRASVGGRGRADGGDYGLNGSARPRRQRAGSAGDLVPGRSRLRARRPPGRHPIPRPPGFPPRRRPPGRSWAAVRCAGWRWFQSSGANRRGVSGPVTTLEAGTRTPTVPSGPSRRRSISDRAGSTSVTAPGQKAWARRRASSDISAISPAWAALSTRTRDAPARAAGLDAKDARHGLGPTRILAANP